MPRKLLKYEGQANRITYQLKWNWSARNYYDDDNENFVPQPVAGNERNSNMTISSTEPFMVNVDWGDGFTEQFSAVNTGSGYVVVFRSLVYPWDKAPGSGFVVSGYQGIAPHHYTDDDKNVLRIVTIEATGPITQIATSTFVQNAFPIVESSSLFDLVVSEAKFINDVPWDRFDKIPNLTRLKINSGVSPRITKIPSSILNLNKITSLTIENAMDCSDIEASGVRGLVNLQKLTHLNMGGNRIPNYLKEYNEIPGLTGIAWFMGAMGSNIVERDWSLWPSMDEVDEFHPGVTSINCISYRDSGRDKFPVFRRGINWNDGSSFNCSSIGNLETRYPDWLYDVRKLKYMERFQSTSRTAAGQIKQDEIIDQFYDFVTSWEYITMNSTASDGNRNQFYGLSWRLISGTFPNHDPRPSGTYQAPSGFIKGQSNGSPASPMEKIYALVENYNMVITVREEETTASTRTLSSPKPVYKIAIRDGVAHIGSGDLLISNPEKVFHADTEEEVLSVLDELGGGIDKSMVIRYFEQEKEGFGPEVE